jgi:hypothetical protein
MQPLASALRVLALLAFDPAAVGDAEKAGDAEKPGVADKAE